MKKIFELLGQKLKASIQSVPHSGFLGSPGSQKPLFKHLLSRELLLPPRPAPWLAELGRAWFHPPVPEPRPATRLYVYENFPWAPLIWTVMVPLGLFVWGLSRRFWSQLSLDLGPWLDLALNGLGQLGPLVFLAPALTALVWSLLGPGLGWGWALVQDLRRLRWDHLCALHLWAYQSPAYRALFLGAEDLFYVLMEKLALGRAPYGFLGPVWALVCRFGRLGRYHLFLALVELMVHQGKLELWFRLSPWLGLVYGLSVVCFYLAQWPSYQTVSGVQACYDCENFSEAERKYYGFFLEARPV